MNNLEKVGKAGNLISPEENALVKKPYKRIFIKLQKP